MELSAQGERLFLRISEERGEPWTTAFFLSQLPRAKKNPEGYLFHSYENGAEPSAASMAKAETVLDACSQVSLEVGEEILPAQWVEAAKVLRLPLVSGSPKDRQERLLSDINDFLSREISDLAVPGDGE